MATTTYEIDESALRPKLRQIYWRPNGGAAAIYLGQPETNDDDDGYPAPRYLVVLTWKSEQPDHRSQSQDRKSAEAANSRGMRLYRSKDYAGAAQAFRAAIISEETYVLPHYNLACVAALTGDKPAAIAELKWLASSGDPIARTKLQKSRSDPDLRTVIDDPEVRTLLE